MCTRFTCFCLRTCTQCAPKCSRAPESLGCPLSAALFLTNAHEGRWKEVYVGEVAAAGGGEWEGNVRCIIYRFSPMSMLCAHFPVTFQRLREKKQQNNVMERKTFSAAQ